MTFSKLKPCSRVVKGGGKAKNKRKNKGTSIKMPFLPVFNCVTRNEENKLESKIRKIINKISIKNWYFKINWRNFSMIRRNHHCVRFIHRRLSCRALRRVASACQVLLWSSPQSRECLPLLNRTTDRSNKILDDGTL